MSLYFYVCVRVCVKVLRLKDVCLFAQLVLLTPSKDNNNPIQVKHNQTNNGKADRSSFYFTLAEATFILARRLPMYHTIVFSYLSRYCKQNNYNRLYSNGPP